MDVDVSEISGRNFDKSRYRLALVMMTSPGAFFVFEYKKWPAQSSLVAARRAKNESDTHPLMDMLPAEMVASILDHVTEPHMRECCRRVCTQMRALVAPVVRQQVAKSVGSSGDLHMVDWVFDAMPAVR